jgi:maltokinase
MSEPDLARAIADADIDALPLDDIAAWLTAQRWFGSKLRDVHELRVLDLIVLDAGDPVVAIVIAEARFGPGTHELYQLPLAVRPLAGWDGSVVAVTADHVAYDALLDEAAVGVIAAHFAARTSLDRPAGHVGFHWSDEVPPPRAGAGMREMGAEQSNTSVVLDERLVLKVFRRLQPGVNPELEMLRFLADHGFPNIAALAGWSGYTGELMDATLAVVQHYVGDAGDGWALALDALAAGDRSFVQRLGELGAVTGRMHAALASDTADAEFAPEEPTVEMLSLLSATIDEQIERVFDDLRHDDPALAPIAGRGEEVRDHLQTLSHIGVGGRLIRIHGDYHLGQTMLGPGGWTVLDFEGEPARALVERRRKRSPLRDVAGMLRSLSYAASAAVLLRGAEVPAEWQDDARARFLAGYMAEVDPAILPGGAAAIAKLLAIFELERAIYELRYELNNRPDWVGIPVSCITRLLREMPV